MKTNDIKVINKNFLAVYYFQKTQFRKNVFDKALEHAHKFMKELRKKVDKGYEPNSDELFMMHHQADIQNTIILLHDYDEHEFFYIPQSVQEHIQLIHSYKELLNYYKLDIKYISSLKNQNSIYILNEKEFFIFFIVEQAKMVVWHFVEDESGSVKKDEFICCLEEEWVENMNLDNENVNKFLKILLFMNLSKPSIEVIKDNEIINDKQNDSKFNKIKNESGLNINFVRIE